MSDQRVSPTSFAQRRLILMDKIDGGAAYNLTRVIRIDGALDPEALAQALAKIVQRHASFRTRFVFEAEDAYQIVDDSVDCRLLVTDLSHLPESDREPEAMRLAREAGSKRFDLKTTPLFRYVLFRLAPARHLLAVVMHHVITDGWSMSILFDEIGQIYGEQKFGTPAQLEGISLQYSDFARLQRETMSDEKLRPHAIYWSNKLKGHDGFIELPTDRVRPAVQSHDGAIEKFTIREDVAQALKRVAQGLGASMFMVLLAAFQTLLSRYANSSDILIGTPIAARNDVRFETLIGFFVNTLVMRGDLSGNPTFSDLLRRTREATLEAYDHQELPFEKVVEALKPARNSSFTPLFQIMFVLQNTPKQVLDLPGLRLEELDFDRGSAMFDLTLEVLEQDGLQCAFEYCVALFDRATVRSFARSFETLLGDIAENADRPLSELRVLDADARNRLVFEFNATRTNYRRDARIEQIFEQQVERTPNRVALVEGETQITFQELNRRADAVANALAREGPNQARPVGVFMERSIDAVVAFLAALKVNAPYVSLDISNPIVRLQRLIADSGCTVVLTHRGRQIGMPESVKTLTIEELSHANQGPPAVISGAKSDDLAYIIYTSGSTGMPKGVEGRHRASINRFEWMWRTYPFSPDETCCAKSALGFVDSIWEIFGPLLAGIRTVIVPEELLLEADRFVELLGRFEVSRIVLVPSLLRALLDAVPDLAARLPKLTLWTLSGEVLAADLARKFRQSLPGATLLNIYGSSEVTADVTFYEVDRTAVPASVPIGKPISNTQIYVLDRNKNLAPPLVPGEIHVGGDCLARGYWRQPELTAQRFIPNPVQSDVSPVLFATGDLGRTLADGNIEYLGRLDKQIKLRGMRVEPGEIEANLIAHPQVREAVILMRGESSETQHLVAYIVKSQLPGPSPDDLRHFLQSRVPPYMIPAMFVELERMPLLPSGKIDRLALPRPTFGAHSKRRVAARARSEIETRLTAIWKEVLELGEISVDDNFFDLGGHSLDGMRVLSRVRRDFHIDVPIRVLFDGPTIAEFANELEKRRAEGETIQAARSLEPVPQSSGMLSILRAELSTLPDDQFDTFMLSVAAERRARMGDKI
jgi:amino acid adenylation domain-containing protein